MFLLNNIDNRPYTKVYPEIAKVILDLSETQLKNSKNKDWNDIIPGSIACVVDSLRKMSTFYRVDAKITTDVFEDGRLQVITGSVVGKLAHAGV